MLNSLLAFAIVSVIFYLLFVLVKFLENPATNKENFLHVVTAVVIVVIIAASAFFEHTADVDCKAQGGVLARGTFLYVCVATPVKRTK